MCNVMKKVFHIEINGAASKGAHGPYWTMIYMLNGFQQKKIIIIKYKQHQQQQQQQRNKVSDTWHTTMISLSVDSKYN